MLFFILGIIAMVSVGCDEDDPQLKATTGSAPIAAEIDIDQVVIDGNNLMNPALTLSWEEADYSVQSPITYKVEVSVNQEFENSFIATSTNETAASYTMSRLNAIAGELMLPAFEWNNIYIRIKASLGTQDGLELISNPLVIDIYPFYSYPYEDYYIVGNACLTDWVNDNQNPPLFRNSTDENLYSYTGYFNGDPNQFKFLATRGQWAPQYGAEGNNLILRATDADPDPPAIDVSTEGYKIFTANLEDMTFTLEEYTDDIIDVPAVVTIKGSSTEQAQTLELIQRDAGFDPHIWWSGTITLLQGELQFEIDGVTLGAETEFSGEASENGGSIPIPVGDDFEVWYNSLTSEYHLIPLNFTN